VIPEVLDALPAHDADAERGLLGSVLIKPAILDRLDATVEAADFYLDEHQRIFHCMLALRRDGVAIDTLTLANALRQGGELESVGGNTYLAEVLGSCPTSANAMYYAKIVRNDSDKRRLRRTAERTLVDLAIGKSTDDLLTSVRSDLDRIERGPGAPVYPPVLVRLSDVQPEPVQWLWPGRIAMGKLTLLAGDPGLGKSFLSLDMAARVSLGSAWPDNSCACAPQGGVVLLTAEDGLADTVRPRLDAMGADVSRIVALEAVMGNDRMPVNLQRDLGALEDAIRQVADCRLLVIDPVSEYLGKVDSHNNADVRMLLHPLAELAERHKVAVLCVTHLNKGSGTSALYRATGSMAFVAAARAAWLVAKDPRNSQRRLFVPAKNNLVEETLGMAFTIGDGVLRWEPDPVVIDADQALEPSATESDDVTGWLRGTLADGPVQAKELFEAAHDEGITAKQLRRAKTKLGVMSRKAGFGAGWEWRLAGESAQIIAEDAQGALPEKQGAFGHLGASSNGEDVAERTG
jgi:hypothetical protein